MSPNLHPYTQGQSVTGKYTYSGPIIENVTEASMFGGWVTVTGKNFGPLSDCAANPTTCNIDKVWIAGAALTISDTKAKVTKARTEMMFYAPAAEVVEVPLDLQLTISVGRCKLDPSLKATCFQPLNLRVHLVLST